jgi:hypothetical protein
MTPPKWNDDSKPHTTARIIGNLQRKDSLMPATQIKIDTIKLLPELQHRGCDNKVVGEYAELLKEGVKFPAVSVLFDGTDFLLWDGFHRLYAHKEAGIDSIDANISKGDMRDAIWMSFSANVKHGTPLPTTTKRDIIETILRDDEWCWKKQQEIADHVGVTRQYISKVQSDLDAARTRPVTSDMATVAKSEDLEENEVLVTEKADRSGRKIKTDVSGMTVPDDIAEVFKQSKELSKYMSAIAKIRKEINEQVEGKNPLYAHLEINQLSADLKNAWAQLKFARPHAICPYCHAKLRKTCKVCKTVGWLPKEVWERVPPEIRGGQ